MASKLAKLPWNMSKKPEFCFWNCPGAEQVESVDWVEKNGFIPIASHGFLFCQLEVL